MQSIGHSLIPFYIRDKIAKYYGEEGAEDPETLQGAPLSIHPGAAPHYDVSIPSPVAIYDAARPLEIVYSNAQRDPNRQAAAVCYENICRVDSFYREVLRIHPTGHLNDNTINAHISDARYFDNAKWCGTYISFGPCRPDVFQRDMFYFDDVIAHELGHSIIQGTSNLNYQGQSGALNESICDIFAMQFKHRKLNILHPAAEDADWTFARDIINMGGGIYAPLRSLESPGSAFFGHFIYGNDCQVGNLSQYVWEDNPNRDNDFGGVHKYSGIPNLAFCRAAKGIGRPIWETIGKIWLQALNESSQDDNFKNFAGKTVSIAQQKFGNSIANEVGNAWWSVGVSPNLRWTTFKAIGSALTFLAGVADGPAFQNGSGCLGPH